MEVVVFIYRFITTTHFRLLLILPSFIMTLDGISVGLKVLRLSCVLDAARLVLI